MLSWPSTRSRQPLVLPLRYTGLVARPGVRTLRVSAVAMMVSLGAFLSTLPLSAADRVPVRIVPGDSASSDQPAATGSGSGSGSGKSASAERTSRRKSDGPNPAGIARQIDLLLEKEFAAAGQTVAPRCRDEDYLRRIMLDLSGRLPTAERLVDFLHETSADKRTAALSEVLDGDDWARPWAQYWRDVIFLNATNMRSRIMQPVFEDWLTEEFARGAGWDEVARAMITATGEVQENGATALIFAHDGETEDVAAETSRIFLGVQIQCANCHDHPTDKWKRQQFHELAAYFPRMVVRRELDGGRPSFTVLSANERQLRGGEMLRENPELVITRLDRNRDGKLSKDEAQRAPRGQLGRFFDRMLENADTNKDGALSAEEFKSMPQPENNRRGSLEHFMPDLNDPTSRGSEIHPRFFLTGRATSHGLSDEERRNSLAASIVDSRQPYFSQAFVNRVWTELMGDGFVSPVDDMGPGRTPVFPEVLELLAKGFVKSGHDPRWLLETICRTEAYQRSLQAPVEGELPFAAMHASPLRADALFNSLLQVLDVPELAGGPGRRPRYQGQPAAGPMAMRMQSPRSRFTTLFAVDPSVPKVDIVGNVPQSLLMMNGAALQQAMSSRGPGYLARLLRDAPDNSVVTRELYLTALCRMPTQDETEIVLEYVRQESSREVAFEDVLWSLINTAEFRSRR